MNPNFRENSMASSAPTLSASTTARRARAARNLLPRPKAGEVRVRVGALGMTPLGLQAAGLVDAVGPEAAGFAPGDRVCYRATPENSGLTPIISERDLIGFPKDIAIETAAALLPYGVIARTIVKQLHPIGRGNRVFVAPSPEGIDEFVTAWVADLGGEIVDNQRDADVVIAASDYAAARRWRYGQGLSQQAAVDVFQAVRRGVFAHLPIASYPLADAERVRSELTSRGAAGPVVLLPTAA